MKVGLLGTCSAYGPKDMDDKKRSFNLLKEYFKKQNDIKIYSFLCPTTPFLQFYEIINETKNYIDFYVIEIIDPSNKLYNLGFDGYNNINKKNIYVDVNKEEVLRFHNNLFNVENIEYELGVKYTNGFLYNNENKFRSLKNKQKNIYFDTFRNFLKFLYDTGCVFSHKNEQRSTNDIFFIQEYLKALNKDFCFFIHSNEINSKINKDFIEKFFDNDKFLYFDKHGKYSIRNTFNDTDFDYNETKKYDKSGIFLGHKFYLKESGHEKLANMLIKSIEGKINDH